MASFQFINRSLVTPDIFSIISAVVEPLTFKILIKVLSVPFDLLFGGFMLAYGDVDVFRSPHAEVIIVVVIVVQSIDYSVWNLLNIRGLFHFAYSSAFPVSLFGRAGKEEREFNFV